MQEGTPKLRVSIILFKRVFFLIKPFWKKIFKGIFLGLITGLIGMLTPYLTKLLIDKVYPLQDISLMHVIVLSILTLSIGSVMFDLLQGYYNLYIGSDLSNSTSLMFFNHLQHLNMRFFEEHRVGEIMSRFGDVSNSLSIVNKVFSTIFVSGGYLIIVPPFLFLLHWKLALVSIVSTPITILLITFSGSSLRKYWKQSSEKYADLNAFQVETFSQIRPLKSLNLENYVFAKAQSKMKSAFEVQLKAGGMGQLVSGFNGLIRAFSTALFTFLGWTYILNNEMSLGDYIAFSSYLGYFYNPISQLVGLFSEFQHSSINLSRMFEYIDIPTEQNAEQVYQKKNEIKKRIKGNIEINNICFGYSTNKILLKNINLKIKSRTVNAIIGVSGCGKTTLLKLLNKFENPFYGTIEIDGININDYNINEIRQQISVIWQEFSIFSGSIKENLILGIESKISDKKIIDVLKLCCLDELVLNLPEGINSSIGEWGATLSGGQKQRLAIARALLRNSPVIIFDEATSNVDVKTEVEILKKIFDECNDKTIIFVTHRICTASLADNIIVMNQGEIDDTGKHEYLIKTNEVYRTLNSYSVSSMLETDSPKEGADGY